VAPIPPWAEGPFKKLVPLSGKQASVVAVTGKNPDPALQAFYQKKRAEGKHHSTCIGAVSRKLCYITFSVLKENRPFELR